MPNDCIPVGIRIGSFLIIGSNWYMETEYKKGNQTHCLLKRIFLYIDQSQILLKYIFWVITAWLIFFRCSGDVKNNEVQFLSSWVLIYSWSMKQLRNNSIVLKYWIIYVHRFWTVYYSLLMSSQLDCFLNCKCILLNVHTQKCTTWSVHLNSQSDPLMYPCTGFRSRMSPTSLPEDPFL